MNNIMTKKPLIVAIIVVLAIVIIILSTSDNSKEPNTNVPPPVAQVPKAKPLQVMPLAWLEFVKVTPGEFMMGCDSNADKCQEDELPLRKVNIDQEFSISKFEITQKAWQEIMQNNPATFVGEQRPIETISYDDVQLFIDKLNQMAEEPIFRLPSEAEWEYIARAGQNNKYPLNNEEQLIEQIAWFGKKETTGTQDVGKLAPNMWGIHDLAGNVMEWVEDCWHDNYQQAPTDASARTNANCESRALRGGSWIDSKDYIRTAYRNNWDNNYRSHEIGFRLVRIEPKGKFSNYPPEPPKQNELQQSKSDNKNTVGNETNSSESE